jgi:hypothetical protein
MNDLLTNEQKAEFQKNGLLVIKHFYDADEISAVQKGIYEIIGQIYLKNHIADTRKPYANDTFDNGFQALIKKNRVWGGEVYDAIKQIPAFLRLVSHPRHERVFKELRKDAVPGIAAGGYGIRIDNPSEDKFRAMWHQEYPAQLRSINGLVFWSPLVIMEDILGPVKFCPGSHVEGPIPVFEADPEYVGRNGAYALKLKDEDYYIGKYQQISPLLNPCDVVILDYLVVHASGYNRGNRSRWSMQFRYFDFNDPIGRQYSWKGSFAAGVDFRQIHPELYFEQ